MKLSFICTKDKLKRQLNIQYRQELVNQYNISPLDSTYILTNTSRELQFFRWGLIPSSAKDVSAGDNLSMAMSEAVSYSPSFRMPIRQRRCIIFVDSYYEMKTKGRLSQPFRVYSTDKRILCLAGLWDLWQPLEGGDLHKTFSVITVSASESPLWDINTRMPAILDTPEACDRWLSDIPLAEVLEMLRASKNALLDWYPVTTDAELIGYQDEILHKRIEWNGFES